MIGTEVTIGGSASVLDGVRHALFLGTLGTTAAGLYLAATWRQVAPRFRTTPILAAVTAAGAAVLLAALCLIWHLAPSVDADALAAFNGYRFVAWALLGPMLAATLLTVSGVAGRRFFRLATRLGVACVAFAGAGYATRFYPPPLTSIAGFGGGPGFWVCLGVAGASGGYLALAVGYHVFGDLVHMPDRAARLMAGVRRVLLAAMALLVVGVAMPGLVNGEVGAVAQQAALTLGELMAVGAGVMVARVALYLSAYEGFMPAVQACSVRPARYAILHDELNNPADLVRGVDPIAYRISRQGTGDEGEGERPGDRLWD